MLPITPSTQIVLPIMLKKQSIRIGGQATLKYRHTRMCLYVCVCVHVCVCVCVCGIYVCVCNCACVFTSVQRGRSAAFPKTTGQGTPISAATSLPGHLQHHPPWLCPAATAQADRLHPVCTVCECIYVCPCSCVFVCAHALVHVQRVNNVAGPFIHTHISAVVLNCTLAHQPTWPFATSSSTAVLGCPCSGRSPSPCVHSL